MIRFQRLRTQEWLYKAEVTLTGEGEDWLAGWLTGAMVFGRGEAGNERMKVFKILEDGEMI